jgi:hypothetical protein
MFHPLTTAFGLLSHGIDAEARGQGDSPELLAVDQDLSNRDRELGRAILTTLDRTPGITLLQLEDVLGQSQRQSAIVPGLVTEAHLEGLVDVKPAEPGNVRLLLTSLGKQRLDAAQAELRKARGDVTTRKGSAIKGSSRPTATSRGRSLIGG